MKIISFFNRKGGVGKTTITDSMASLLAEDGFGVLKIDIDPQGSLSHRSFDKDFNNIKNLAEQEIRGNVCDLFEPGESVLNCIYETEIAGVDIIPAVSKHITTEDIIKQRISNTRYSWVKIKEEMTILNKLTELEYDYILFDCSPSLSIINVCALNISNFVIIPMLSSISSIEGLHEVEKLVEESKSYNPEIEILGTIINMKENTNNDKDIYKQLEELNLPILGEIRKATVIKKAERENKPINLFDKKSKVCQDFIDLKEIIKEMV